METAIEFITANKANIAFTLTGIYEILVRLFPTKKSWSLLSLAIRIFSLLVPDRKTGGGKH